MQKLAIIMVLALLGCQEIEPMATVEGTVKISPLCGSIPIVNIDKNGNPCGFSDEQLDNFYGQYAVVIKNASDAVVNRKKLDRTGAFSFEVKVGTYLLDIETVSSGALISGDKAAIQKRVTLEKNEVKKVEMYVNTGIR
jgi:hypothetical protein